jgi:hypothetical protein
MAGSDDPPCRVERPLERPFGRSAAGEYGALPRNRGLRSMTPTAFGAGDEVSGTGSFLALNSLAGRITIAAVIGKSGQRVVDAGTPVRALAVPVTALAVSATVPVAVPIVPPTMAPIGPPVAAAFAAPCSSPALRRKPG